MIVVYVALGAAIGAPLRYLIDRAVQTWRRTAFPVGTLTVNVLASFVLGVLTGVSASATTTAFAATGLCGALSTFSTFGWETVALARDRKRTLAVLNVLASTLLCLAVAAAGWALMAA